MGGKKGGSFERINVLLREAEIQSNQNDNSNFALLLKVE